MNTKSIAILAVMSYAPIVSSDEVLNKLNKYETSCQEYIIENLKAFNIGDKMSVKKQEEKLNYRALVVLDEGLWIESYKYKGKVLPSNTFRIGYASIHEMLANIPSKKCTRRKMSGDIVISEVKKITDRVDKYHDSNTKKIDRLTLQVASMQAAQADILLSNLMLIERRINGLESQMSKKELQVQIDAMKNILEIFKKQSQKTP